MGRRKKPGSRHKCGKLIQCQEPSSAIRARQRHYGLSAAAAKSQEAGTVVGRLHLDRAINRGEYLAAQRYMALRDSYLRIKGVMPPQGPRSEDDARLNPSLGCEICGLMIPCDACSTEAARKTDAAWARVQDLIEDRSTRDRYPYASALKVLVVDDQHLDHLVQPLRIILMVLAHHWHLDTDDEAAEFPKRYSAGLVAKDDR